MPASNHTFLTRLGDSGVQCVYKPSSGERPLWDFTDGTLAAREYAAWVVSDHLGWDVVPPTVLRDGPAGPGMVQLWMESEETAEGRARPRRRGARGAAAARVPARARRHGRPRRAGDAGPRGLAGAAPDGGLRPRREQHRPQGRARAADGRTVIATASTTASASTPRTSCARCSGAGPACDSHRRRPPAWRRCWTASDGDLRESLEDLLTVREVDAVARRCERLLRTGSFPVPSGGWPSIPWPPF